MDQKAGQAAGPEVLSRVRSLSYMVQYLYPLVPRSKVASWSFFAPICNSAFALFRSIAASKCQSIDALGVQPDETVRVSAIICSQNLLRLVTRCRTNPYLVKKSSYVSAALASNAMDDACLLT